MQRQVRWAWWPPRGSAGCRSAAGGLDLVRALVPAAGRRLAREHGGLGRALEPGLGGAEAQHQIVLVVAVDVAQLAGLGLRLGRAEPEVTRCQGRGIQELPHPQSRDGDVTAPYRDLVRRLPRLDVDRGVQVAVRDGGGDDTAPVGAVLEVE